MSRRSRPQYRSGLGWILGVAFRRHADPTGPACSRVHLRSVLRYASGFFPTRPHGASTGVSRRQGLRAVASGSRLLPPRPAKDFHLQSSAHARHTSVGLRPPFVPTPMRQRQQTRQDATYRSRKSVQTTGASSVGPPVGLRPPFVQPLCGKDSKPGRTPLIVRGNLSRRPEPALHTMYRPAPTRP